MKRARQILVIILSVLMMMGLIPESAFAMEMGQANAEVIENVEETVLDIAAESEDLNEQEAADPYEQESSVVVPDDVLAEEDTELTFVSGTFNDVQEAMPEEDAPKEEFVIMPRAEWIHEVAVLFTQQADVEYAHAYFSDYTEADIYYEDVMKALSDGALFISEGEAFEPDSPVTREFAAHTLNAYLGIIIDESKEYTFFDEELEFPDDAQVALNRGWFDLEDGYFHGDKSITRQEASFMIEDARNLRSAVEIDTDYESNIQFEKCVIEVPDGTEIVFNSNDQITIVDCPVEIREGNTFIVYMSGLPIAYQALSVHAEGNRTIICVEKAGDEAYIDIDEQGILELTEDNSEIIPLTEEIESVVGSNGSEIAGTNVQFKDGKLVVEMEALDGLKAEAYIGNLSLAHSFSDRGYSVVLNGSWGYKGNMTFSNSLHLPIAELRIYGVGAIKISVDLSESMETAVDFGGTFSTGIAIDSDGTKRVIREFNTNNTNNVTIKGTMSLSFKVTAGVDILFLSSDIYSEIGIETQYTSQVTYDTNQEKSVHCQDFRFYIFQNVGVEAEYYSIWTGKKEKALNEPLELPENMSRPFSFVVHFEDGKKVGSCNYGMIVDDLQIECSISANFESTVGSDNRDRVLETDVSMPGDLVVEEDYTVSNGVLDLNGHVLTIEGDLIQTGGEIRINGGRLIVNGSYKIQGEDWKPSEGILTMGSSDQLDIEGDFIIQSNQKSNLTGGILRLKGDFYQFDTNKVTANVISNSSFTLSMCGGGTQVIHLDSPIDNNLGFLRPENNITADNGMSISGCSLNGHSLFVNGDLKQNSGTFKIEGGNVTVEGDIQLEDGDFKHTGGTLTISGDMIIARTNSDGSYLLSYNRFSMESEDASLIINGNLLTDLYTNMNCSAGTMWLKGDWINMNPNNSNASPYQSGGGSFTLVLNGSGTQRLLNKATYTNTIPILKMENASARSLVTEGRLSIGKLDADALSITARNNPVLTIGTTTSALDISGDVTLNVTEKSGGDINVNGNMITDNGFKVSGKSLTISGNLRQTEGAFTTGGGTVIVGEDIQLEDGDFIHNGGNVTVSRDMLIAQASSDGSYSASHNHFYIKSEEAFLSIAGKLVTYLANPDSWPYGGGITCSSGTVYLKKDWTNFDGANTYSSSGNFKIVLNGSGTQRIQNNSTYFISIPILKIENASARSLVTEGRLSIGKLDADALSITARNNPALTIGTTTSALDISGDVTLNVTEKSGGDISVNGNMITDNGFKVSGKSLSVTGNLRQTGGTFTTGNGNVTIWGDIQLESGYFRHTGGSVTVSGDMAIARTDSDGSYSHSDNHFYMESGDVAFVINGNLLTDLYYAMNCSAGTMLLKGDWTNMNNSYNSYCSGSGSFTLVLNGSGTQRLLNKATYTNTIPILKMENASARSLVTEGRLSIGKLDADALSITARNNPALTIGTTTSALDISGDVTLNVTEKSGGDISVNGNMITDNGFKVSGKSLSVTGNLRQTGGTFTIGSGNVTIWGDIQLESGYFRHTGGSVTVSGDMAIARTDSDGSYSHSDNHFYMESGDAALVINGNLLTDLYYAMNCSAGTMRLKGDWTNMNNSYNSYCSGSGSFTLVLNGRGTQRLLNKATYTNTIPILKMENASARSLVTEGRLSIGKLDADALSITAKNTPALTIGTTTSALDISGDVALNVTEKVADSISVNGNVTSNNLRLSGKNMTIHGDFRMIESGTVQIGANGVLVINGEFYHRNGALNFNGGTIHIKGNYLSAIRSSDDSLSSGSGVLNMSKASDLFVIEGDCTIFSSNSSTLTAGTMKISGDFSQLSSSSGSFAPSGTHEVILNGTEKQIVQFTSSGSKFRLLYLEQDITQYEFSPDNCWDILEENPYYNALFRPIVYRVDLTPGDADLMLGDSYQFTAKVIGFNNPSQSVTWWLTGNTSSSTTLSQDGTLVIASDENSDRLVVTAISLTDEEKSMSAVVNITKTNNTPVVGRIIVSATATTVMQGESETFVAIVTGINLPSQDVIWSLEGNIDSETFISNDGILIIGENEPVGTITVTATSAIDNTKHKSVQVKIVKQPVLHVSYKGIPLHEGDSLPELSLAQGDTDGTISLDRGQVLTVGSNPYRWTFVPNNKDSYAEMTGIVWLDVEESALPIPEIIEQPISCERASGEKVSFTVIASGDGLSYQWQYSRVGSSGWTNSRLGTAKSKTLTFNMSAGYNGMRFRCVVTNEYEQSVISDTVTASLKAGPVINTQPVSTETALGVPVELVVEAAGVDLSYQWQYQKPGQNTWTRSGLASATTPVLKFKMSTGYDDIKFRCVVTNLDGESTTSDEVTVSVADGPGFSTLPKDVNASTGTLVKLTAVSTDPDVNYCWQYQKSSTSTWKNSGLSSAGNSTLSFKMSSGYDGMKFRCRVTDAKGRTVYTNTVVITMVDGPSITVQPEDVTTAIGTKATFNVEASGDGLNYQWQYQKPGKTTWVNSSSTGNKTKTVKVSATNGTNAMKFRCVVTDLNGSVSISNSATLTAE